MQDSQPSGKASDPILSKLIEADSELTHQEAELLARLETIQEKRKGLKTVIGMFSLGGSSTSDLLQQLGEMPNSKTNGTASAIAEAATNGTVAIAANTTELTPAERPSKTPRQSKGKTSRKTDPVAKESASKSKGGRADSKAAKPARRSLGWQQYIRDEFGKSSLAEAIPQVLGRRPGEVLETGEIIDAIFVTDIPKEARSTVRERVSNILSAGLKVNKWYRGKTGCYSLSKSAAESSLTS